MKSEVVEEVDRRGVAEGKIVEMDAGHGETLLEDWEGAGFTVGSARCSKETTPRG
jgi:hypothetical protein